MYAYINGEKWGMDACPALTEQHGWLCDPLTGEPYGRLLRDDEDQVVNKALVAWHGLRELPLEY